MSDTPSSTAQIIDDVLAGAGTVAPLIPVPLAQAIIILVSKYGPDVVNAIDAFLRKADSGKATIDDARAIFGQLRSLESFNLPAVVPSTPVTPASSDS